jgi:hypothetical protein
VRACTLLRSIGLTHEVRLEVDPDFALGEAWPAVRVRQGMQIFAAVHDGPEIAEELRTELKRHRADDAEVRALWCRLAREQGPEAVPRVVWAACAQLVARRRDQPRGLWDPRLEEVATLTAIVATHWAAMGAPLPAEPGAESWGQCAQRLRAASPAAGLVAWELARLADWRQPTAFALRAGAQRAAAVCDVVVAHAMAIAARTRNADIAACYRALAADCAAVVAAAAALR